MISLKNFWQAAEAELRAGRCAVLCLIVSKQGSAPRGPGAHMLVRQDGSTLDTIGGGALEHEVTMQAQRNLHEKKSSLSSFALDNNDAAKEGMICGGRLRVLLLHLSKADLNAVGRMAALAYRGESAVLGADWHSGIFSLSAWSSQEDFPGKAEILDRKLKSLLTEDGESGSYREICRQMPVLYLFGGGWVAQETAKLLPALEFDCVLLEERPEFARKELFPHVRDIVMVNFDDFAPSVQIKPSDFAVVVTSGHRKDTVILEQLLKISPAYIGAIGSRRKKAVIGKYLKERGFSDEQIDSIHLPIGINIAAQTPAEIAVSIAAELIQCRAEL